MQTQTNLIGLVLAGMARRDGVAAFVLGGGAAGGAGFGRELPPPSLRSLRVSLDPVSQVSFSSNDPQLLLELIIMAPRQLCYELELLNLVSLSLKVQRVWAISSRNCLPSLEPAAVRYPRAYPCSQVLPKRRCNT